MSSQTYVLTYALQNRAHFLTKASRDVMNGFIIWLSTVKYGLVHLAVQTLSRHLKPSAAI